ncbi:MAG: hypothetical protein HUJ51_03555 [Eggerthellaceae bacterium]|nr:hypothetical protein [Eggerthellaceae bacterium]
MKGTGDTGNHTDIAARVFFCAMADLDLELLGPILMKAWIQIINLINIAHVSPLALDAALMPD